MPPYVLERQPIRVCLDDFYNLLPVWDYPDGQKCLWILFHRHSLGEMTLLGYDLLQFHLRNLRFLHQLSHLLQRRLFCRIDRSGHSHRCSFFLRRRRNTGLKKMRNAGVIQFQLFRQAVTVFSIPTGMVAGEHDAFTALRLFGVILGGYHKCAIVAEQEQIIFTEHKDTLNYLAAKIRSLFGNAESVVTIHGGMLRDERRKVEQLFKQDVGVRVLIATDAAGEGINLQRAHLMINYDLPWNPNRLEQRFGRIHRIGQTEVCHLWNLVAAETREGFVFQRLFTKLEEEREALGGKVFDILGKVSFDNKSLRELLIEAVRYGNDPEVRARLNRVVDSSMDPEVFRKMIADSALTDDVMDVHAVNAIREDMERMEAHKLQPFFIEAFFLEAFKNLGGKIRKRETGRYEITSVPYAVRNRDIQIGFGEPVLNRYERVCFDKMYCNIPGLPQAALLCPGHPLLEATIDLIREKNVDVMKRGAVFIDDSDYSQDAKLLFYIEDAVQDGTVLKDGKRRTISKHIHFVELKEDGTASSAGYAPYLDYRTATDGEYSAIRQWMSSQTWLCKDVEDLAKGYAIEHLIPPHFSEVKRRKEAMANKTSKAVRERLSAEIRYWDYRSGQLAEKEAAGKSNSKLNSQMAARRAEELESRLQNRLAELELEKRISPMPPVITGGALVIPRGLLHKMTGRDTPGSFGQGDRQAVEFAAMNAVLQIEAELGYQPKDVSASKCGYDVESFVPEELRGPEGNVLRFVEVKQYSLMLKVTANFEMP